MAFWVYYSYGPRKVHKGQGYFNCPRCPCLQPCTLCQVENSCYLYGLIRLSGAEPIGPELYV